MNQKKRIILQLDYLQGPIWISDADTGKPLTGIPCIDEDPCLMALNHQASQLYSSFYELNSHNSPCWFNEEKATAEKAALFSLLTRILSRLHALNDGSFVVEDRESERWRPR